MRTGILIFVWLCHAATLADGAFAQSKDDMQLVEMKSFAAGYRLDATSATSPAAVVHLHPSPLLRWNNQIIQEDDAAMFLWTIRGRPLLASQFFKQGDAWHHEFQLMGEGALQVEYADGWLWRPSPLAIEWHSEVDDPNVADNESARLSQMRRIARKFRASCFPDQQREELRLLTTPVYRYLCKEDGIVDGAIFAFAQGTNPEILMMIEASTDNKAQASKWRYSFSPMTSWKANVVLEQVEPSSEEKSVWSQERKVVPTQDTLSDYQFRWKVHSAAEH
jgi:hypothetical protein